MNFWTLPASLLVLLIATSCSGDPPAQPPPQPPPVEAPASPSTDAPKSEAISRADALLEDLKRRQEAQEKDDPEDAAAAREENRWKDQMRVLELALNEKEIKLAAAERANLEAGDSVAQAEYKKIVAEVASARQAIEQLRDEAKRAGIPPSWLK
jgi:hypothetical protein